MDIAKTKGHNVICIKDVDVREEDANDADLVIALGGDHTYLIAS